MGNCDSIIHNKVKLNANYLNLMISIMSIVYFSSKMLFDYIFSDYVEYLSLLIILAGTFFFFVNEFLFKFNKNKIVIILVIFWTYIIFNGLYFNNLTRLNRGIYEYIFYSFIILAYVYFLKYINIDTLNSQFKFISFYSLIISILSIYEFILKKSLITGDFRGTLVNNVLTYRVSLFSRSYLSHGAILGILFIISIYCFIISRKKIYLIISLLNIGAILTTFSRGPLVSAIIALVLFYILEKRIKKYKLLFGVVILMLLIFLFINSLNLDKITNEIVYSFLYRIQNIFNWKNDAGNVGRLAIWERIINIIKDNMIFGIGVSSTGSYSSTTIGVTESGVLKRIVELGILGASLYYLFLFKIIKKTTLCYQKVDEPKRKMFNLGYSVICLILIDDIVIQVTEEISVYFFFAYFISLIIVLSKKESSGYD